MAERPIVVLLAGKLGDLRILLYHSDHSASTQPVIEIYQTALLPSTVLSHWNLVPQPPYLASVKSLLPVWYLVMNDDTDTK